MNRLRSNTGQHLLVLGLSAFLASAWVVSCGGNTSQPTAGGESHFLDRCNERCGSNLKCISGLCTQACVVGDDGCRRFDANAICTNESIEPGEVAVCDVACEDSADCRLLGDRHVCDDGFCRGPVTDPGASGDGGNGGGASGDGSSGGTSAGGSPGSGGSRSSGGAGGSLSSGGATSSGGSQNSGGSPGSGGSGGSSDPDPIVLCPDDIDTDPVDIDQAIVEGDQLTLVVGYSGGCEEHEFSVCYDGAFRESYPVQTTLRLLHDANDDGCEAYLRSTVTMDLTPLADAYKAGYQTDGGLISTNYGLYAFGELSCEERELAGDAQATTAAEQADHGCSTADDCVWTALVTDCSFACGRVVSTTGAEELSGWLESTSTYVCGDFEADGCDPVLPLPCPAPPPLECIDGVCAMSDG